MAAFVASAVALLAVRRSNVSLETKALQDSLARGTTDTAANAIRASPHDLTATPLHSQNASDTRVRAVHISDAPPFCPVYGIPIGHAQQHVVPSCPVAWVTYVNNPHTQKANLYIRAAVIDMDAVRGGRFLVTTPNLPRALHDWLESRNVTVLIRNETSELRPVFERFGVEKKVTDYQVGWFARFDLPRILMDASERFRNPKSACDRFVLYSDIDVMFDVPVPPGVKAHRPDPITLAHVVQQLPPFAAVSTDFSGGWLPFINPRKAMDGNPGVMLLNLFGVAASVGPFMTFVAKVATGASDLTPTEAHIVLHTAHGADMAASNYYFGAMMAGFASKLHAWRAISGIDFNARLLHWQSAKCEAFFCDGHRNATFSLPRVNATLSCENVTSDYMKHMTHIFFARVPLSLRMCHIAYACNATLVDAQTPWKCKPWSPKYPPFGSGILPRAMSVRECDNKWTCAYFVPQRDTRRRVLTDDETASRMKIKLSQLTRSRVPRGMQALPSKWSRRDCRPTWVTTLDDYDDRQLALLRSTVEAAHRARVDTPWIIAFSAPTSAVKLVLDRMNVTRRLIVHDEWELRRAVQNATTLQRMVRYEIASLFVRSGRITMQPHTSGCEASLLLFTELGAKVQAELRLSAQTPLPVFFAAPTFCAEDVPWALGVSRCPTSIDDRVMLQNAFGMAAVFPEMMSYVMKAKVTDIANSFFRNAIRVLPPIWVASAPCAHVNARNATFVFDDANCACAPSTSLGQSTTQPTTAFRFTTRTSLCRGGRNTSAHCQDVCPP